MDNTVFDFPEDRYTLMAWREICDCSCRVAPEKVPGDLPNDGLKQSLRCSPCGAQAEHSSPMVRQSPFITLLRYLQRYL